MGYYFLFESPDKTNISDQVFRVKNLLNITYPDLAVVDVDELPFVTTDVKTPLNSAIENHRKRTVLLDTVVRPALDSGAVVLSRGSILTEIAMCGSDQGVKNIVYQNQFDNRDLKFRVVYLNSRGGGKEHQRVRKMYSELLKKNGLAKEYGLDTVWRGSSDSWDTTFDTVLKIVDLVPELRDIPFDRETAGRVSIEYYGKPKESWVG